MVYCLINYCIDTENSRSQTANRSIIQNKRINKIKILNKRKIWMNFIERMKIDITKRIK